MWGISTNASFMEAIRTINSSLGNSDFFSKLSLQSHQLVDQACCLLDLNLQCPIFALLSLFLYSY